MGFACDKCAVLEYAVSRGVSHGYCVKLITFVLSSAEAVLVDIIHSMSKRRQYATPDETLLQFPLERC